MSGGRLSKAMRDEYEIGPVKILLDDDGLSDFSGLVEKMALARDLDRSIAVHCVTGAQLAVALAAFDKIGPKSGDRIEHGSVIHPFCDPGTREAGADRRDATDLHRPTRRPLSSGSG